MKDFLNLGCGNRFHPDWINLDFVSNHPAVTAHDLTKGIPFGDQSFSVVYHSHVLEHFSRSDAREFMSECFRVLKPGGILRVLIPDLEQLAQQYLNMLYKAENHSDPLNEANYEWAVIEMIDQLVREHCGGEMLQYWLRDVILNEGLLENRMGNEYFAFKKIKSELSAVQLTQIETVSTNKRRWWKKNVNSNNSVSFENSGEKHKWMYDRHSLKLLLASVGFSGMQAKTAFESNIPGWEVYKELDVEDGKLRKPDSLIMEAIKPGG